MFFSTIPHRLWSPRGWKEHPGREIRRDSSLGSLLVVSFGFSREEYHSPVDASSSASFLPARLRSTLRAQRQGSYIQHFLDRERVHFLHLYRNDELRNGRRGG